MHAVKVASRTWKDEKDIHSVALLGDLEDLEKAILELKKDIKEGRE